LVAGGYHGSLEKTPNLPSDFVLGGMGMGCGGVALWFSNERDKVL